MFDFIFLCFERFWETAPKIIIILFSDPIIDIRNLNSFLLSGNNYRELVWGALDDVVMGGVSESTFLIDPKGSENGGPTGLFKGPFSVNSRLLFCLVFFYWRFYETVMSSYPFLYWLHQLKKLFILYFFLQELFPLQITGGLQASEQR